jgi:hypothetical protein
MATRAGVLACVFASSILGAAPASAEAPLVIEQVRFDGSPELNAELSDQCGFPVMVETTGHFTGTVFFDNDGQFRLLTGHPSFRETFTSPYATIQSADRGLDKFSITQTGDLLIFGTGIHLRVKGDTVALGLWRLTVDLDTGELISQEYHGNFDVIEPEIGARLCALLGPTP